MLGWKAPEISTASMRLQGYAVWEILTFLLNALLFVLIGLQLPLILDGLSGQPAGELLWWCVAISLVVIVTRLIWGQTVVFLIRRARPPRRSARAPLDVAEPDDHRAGRACAARSRWPPRSRSRPTSRSAT